MSFNITPEELAAMADRQLDELRRTVLDARDARVYEQRTQGQRQAERKRAADVVRDEIRAYLLAGGAPEQLHALLDRVVAQLARQAGAQRPAAGSAGAAGRGTPAPGAEAAGGGTGG